MTAGSASIDRLAVLKGIAALAPGWAARAGQVERDGRVHPETAAELVSLGAHRLLQPATFGGAESTIRDHVTAVALAAEACTSTGWCLAVWSVHNWMLALFPAKAQEEVWGADPAALLSASIAPRNPFVERPDGSLVVQGRFPFGSGCDHASWLLVAGLVPRDGGVEPIMALLERRQVRVDHDSWRVMGLNGTGSKDFVVDEPVEVPAHRVMRQADAVRRAAPGQVGAGPLYQAPFRPVAALVLAPPAIGAAKAALACFVDRMEGHRVRFGAISQRDDPAARLRVAEAAAEIDAAELVLGAAADSLDRLGVAGQADLVAEARVVRDTAYSVRLAAAATDRLFEAAGGSALREDEPLQRMWRDVHAARTHAVLTWDGAATMYADALLG